MPNMPPDDRRPIAGLPAAAITGFVDDVVTVCLAVTCDRERYPRGIPHTRQRLLDAWEIPRCPSLPVLASSAELVLYTLRFNEQYRDLLPGELAIRAAAQRVADAIERTHERAH